MISYDILLQQMAHHIQVARNASPQQLREQLTAIRALCEVGLAETSVQQLPTTTTAPLQATPLQENDANGSSLFDF